MEIAKDVWTVLYQSYTQQYGDFSVDYQPRWNATIEPFLERFETVLAGNTLSITIDQDFDYNNCVLPVVSGFTLPVDVNLVNYKQIIEDMRDIADSHLQVNSFGFGDITQITMDIETKVEPKYLKMYCIPSTVTIEQNQLSINLSIIVLDQINNDYSNQQDVLNDCLEVCKDIFTILYLSEYETEWGAVCSPFIERFETVLGGFTLNVTLTQPFDYNRCVLPITPFNYPWEDIAQLWEQIGIDWENL
jgi:hypothetical protein